MRRNVQQLVIRAIQSGRILTCEKTKVGKGKRVVTVGPYKTAVPTTPKEDYALYIGTDRYTFALAVNAAAEFIEYVGRDLAWKAVHKV